jgi:hypothetical protein
MKTLSERHGTSWMITGAVVVAVGASLLCTGVLAQRQSRGASQRVRACHAAP